MRRKVIFESNGLPDRWLPLFAQVAISEEDAVAVYKKRYNKSPKAMIVLRQQQGDVIYLYS